MAPFPSSRRASRGQILGFSLLGVLAGLCVGYVFIGSVDRILRIRTRQGTLQRRQRFTGNGALSNKSLTQIILQRGQGNQAICCAFSENEGLRQGAFATQTSPNPKYGANAQASSNALRHDQAEQKSRNRFPTTGDTIHTLCTSNGSPYLNYQTRIMYGTFKLVQKKLGGEKLVAFTRILHRTTPDILMDEVPSFRANPLTPECDHWCEFPVSDRPNAVAQFFEAAKRNPSMIKAPWLFMLEGDYVWMKPLQAPRAESPHASWAFPYSYIQPSYPGLKDIMLAMYPPSSGPISDIPATGPAPVLMRVSEWIKIMPDWERLTAYIEANKETKEKLGWVREMYAFSIAVALQKIKLDLQQPPNSPLMAQPPENHEQGNAALLHYTWGILVEDAKKQAVWSFDKRTYTDAIIERKSPKIPLPPPRDPTWRLHDGQPYDASLANLTAAMLTQMNKAIERLPDLDTRA